MDRCERHSALPRGNRLQLPAARLYTIARLLDGAGLGNADRDLRLRGLQQRLLPRRRGQSSQADDPIGGDRFHRSSRNPLSRDESIDSRNDTLATGTALPSDCRYMQALYGRRSGVFVSVLVLVASWGSVFAILLGFSRIPYTAAADGHFFKVFAHLHPTGKFPSISLLAMGGLSVLACLFSLPDLISVLIVVQTMTQFAAQCVAVILLRRRAFATPDSFRMPLFPLPAVIALLGWLYIVLSSNPLHIAIGAAMALTGACAYLLLARSKQEWPFKVPDEA